jgi:cell division protein ZapA
LSLDPDGGMEQLISVVILGEQYTIRATDDPSYVRRVAQYVDTKLEEVVKGSPSLPSNKAIVLASLNIADELFKAEAGRERSEAHVAARLGELSDLLETRLRAGTGSPKGGGPEPNVRGA